MSNREVFNKHFGNRDMLPGNSFFEKLASIKKRTITNYGRGKGLDICCGTGEMLIPLVKSGFEIDGIDYGDEIINRTQSKLEAQGIKSNVFVSDVRQIDCLDDTYDFVYCLSSLYAIDNIDAAISEIKRVLKNGGVAILEFGNRNSLCHYRAHRPGLLDNKVYNLKIGKIINLIEKYEFNVLEWKCFQIFPYYAGYGIEKYIDPCMRETFGTKMFDEIVSSSPHIWQFSFRQLIVLENGYHNPINIDYPMVEWGSVDKVQKRNEGAKFMNEKRFKEGVDIFINLLREDPDDLVTLIFLLHFFQEDCEIGFSKEVRDVAQHIIDGKEKSGLWDISKI